MSRADPGALPAAPRIGSALRDAAVDFYYHSLKLVPLNVAWGAGFAVLFLASVRTPTLFALGTLLGLPTMALFRIAGDVVRGGPVHLSSGIDTVRRRLLDTLLAAGVSTLVAIVLGVNVLLGAANPGVAGWSLLTLAGWGLFALWTGGLAFWALLADPGRELGVRATARLAALLLVAHPARLGAFGVVTLAVAAVSTLLVMPILTITVAYLALVAAHYVLPAADRLEAALAARPSSP